MNPNECESALPRFDPSSEEGWRESLGLKRLHLAWAKAEIVLGLASVVLGLRLLADGFPREWAGGALFVLGGYLAMAGNRSHLYLAMNRQNAHLARLICEGSTRDHDASRELSVPYPNLFPNDPWRAKPRFRLALVGDRWKTVDGNGATRTARGLFLCVVQGGE